MPNATPSTRPAGTAGRKPGSAGRKPWPADPQSQGGPVQRGRGSFLAGLGIGIAVGAAVALLLAPQSGAETRQALRRRGRRVRARAGDAWSDLRFELSRAKRALRRKRRESREMAQGDDQD